MRKLPRKIIAHFSLELWNNEKGSQIIKTSECGLPNDHFGRLTSVTLVLIIKNKLGSAQVPKFGRLLVKIDSSASIPAFIITNTRVTEVSLPKWSLGSPHSDALKIK